MPNVPSGDESLFQNYKCEVNMNFSTKYFLIIFLLFLGTSYVSAQQGYGEIQGTITDATTHEVMIGVNVTLKGTSLGSSSDVYGKYIINAIPPGSYSLKVSYIGYLSKETTVEVKMGSTLELNFSLKAQAIEGEEVVITAQARGQHEAINQQLSSSTITNIVSSEKIRELPDQNAAAAISRLPGISLMNGDQVVIRGIQAKLNTVLINGIQLPSTDMNDRSTNLGFISSNMLSGIEVIKALTPDLDANAIGGVVNLKLREAPSDLHFDVLTQGNYNAQDHTADNYKFWASISDRFLDNKLGVFIQGNADRSDVGDDKAEASYGINAINTTTYGLAPYMMNGFTFTDQQNLITNAGGSIILDYILPHGKVILQNTYAHNISDNTSYINQLHFEKVELDYSIFRDKYEKDLMINALQTEYNFGDVKAEFNLSHSFSNKKTDNRYGDPGNFFGFNNVVKNHPYGVDSAGSAISYYGERPFLTPEDVYNIPIDPTDPDSAQVGGWVVTRAETFKQHLYNSSLDFTVPVSFSEDFSSKFKIGGKFTRSTRSNDVEASFEGAGADDYYANVKNFFPGKVLGVNNKLLFSDLWNHNYTRGQYFLEGAYPFKYAIDKDLMDRFMAQSRVTWLNARNLPSSVRDDFDGVETFSAGYIMGTFNIGTQLSLIAGGRFEHYNMDYHAVFVYVTHAVYGYGKVFDTLNTVNRNDDQFFPNAQLRYKFTDWLDLRLAYTTAISRPDFHAILPNTYYEEHNGGEAGNTKLKPASSTNYDAYLSFYNNDIGLFTVGGFYKEIKNVFYQADFYYQNLKYFNLSFPDSSVFKALQAPAPGPSEKITTFLNNPHPAYIRGIELEWQTNFWYLPKPLNALVLNINYTRAWSDMDYQQIINQPVSYQDGRFTRYHYNTTDTVRNARLIYQGDNILNIALGVDYKGFSGRISFNMQGNVITSVGSRPEDDQFTGNIYKWDFTLQQKLPIDGLSIALNGINIFHNPIYTYQKFRKADGGPILDNLESTDYSPRIFELNLRYSF
jgi:TonB-dependent receptor